MTTSPSPAESEILGRDKLLDLFDRHTNIANALWNFFSSVALAVLAAAYINGTPITNNALRLSLTAGFIVFAFGNARAMFRTASLVDLLGQAIHDKASQHPNVAGILKSHAASKPGHIALTQAIFAACVVAAVWVPYWVGADVQPVATTQTSSST